MLLKRLYDHSGEKPRLAGVSVAHTGTYREQNFSAQLVAEALAAGWMSIAQGKLTLHAREGDLVYSIVRGPGRYCCHCGEKLEEDALGHAARAHIEKAHPGAKSPDQAWPSGYAWIKAYECVLDAEQHQRFRAKPGAPFTFQSLVKRALKAKKGAANG